MTTLVIIRPEPGASATLEAARALGLDASSFPLSEVQPRNWRMPDPADFDAILIGSANVFRAHQSWIEAFRHLPVHAVGQATAEAAREAGFEIGFIGKGGLQSVLDAHEGQKIRYLRLSGSERVDLKPYRGMVIDTRVTYEVVHHPLPQELQQLLASGDCLVLLHSAAAARHFASECDRIGLDRSSISLATIGPRVSAAAGEGWKELRHAPQPNDAALLALVADMCH